MIQIFYLIKVKEYDMTGVNNMHNLVNVVCEDSLTYVNSANSSSATEVTLPLAHQVSLNGQQPFLGLETFWQCLQSFSKCPGWSSNQCLNLMGHFLFREFLSLVERPD